MGDGGNYLRPPLYLPFFPSVRQQNIDPKAWNYAPKDSKKSNKKRCTKFRQGALVLRKNQAST